MTFCQSVLLDKGFLDVMSDTFRDYFGTNKKKGDLGMEILESSLLSDAGVTLFKAGIINS